MSADFGDIPSITKEDPHTFEKRVAWFARNQLDLADAFLAEYTTNPSPFTVVDALKLWLLKVLDIKYPVTEAEMGLVSFAVTHTPDGRRRIRLAHGTKPDVFTGISERHREMVPSERFGTDGDLRQRKDEPTDDFLERAARACGYILGERAQRHIDIRLPYKDPEPREPGQEG
jgi:hypothetical protein